MPSRVLVVAAAALLAGAAFAGGDAVERRSNTVNAPATERTGEASVDVYPELAVEGERRRPASNESASGQGLPGAQKAVLNDFWFFDADVVLFNDDDRDGYYHGIDVLFDVDTLYEAADVYAALYLSFEGGPWNEYAVTDTFTVYGATSDDEYVVVTELMSGYPRGSYDLLIELYDAWSGEFLADLGPEDHSGLAFLPLEDFHRDDPRPRHPGHRHGGGAPDWQTLAFLALLAALAARRRRRRPGAWRLD